MNMALRPAHYRTIWISDIHLGTRGCKADLLLEFLRHTESDTLYLVGDIIDGWRLKRSWYWHQSHNDVVQKLLRKARSEEHTSELQSLMRISYAVFCLKKKKKYIQRTSLRSTTTKTT